MKNAENTVLSNLEAYLTAPEKEAYEAYSDPLISDEDKKKYLINYQRATQKLQNAILVEYARMRGLHYAPRTLSGVSNPNFDITKEVDSRKLGGLLNFYKDGGNASRERIKNADRFIDSIKHQQKLNWKKLERLSKSMYKLPDKA